MKKIIITISALMISMITIFGCTNTFEAKSIISNTKNTQVQASKFSLSDAKNLLSDSLGKSAYKKLLSKPLELANRAKKIKAFYDLAYGDNYAHLYHPNNDLSINESEMLQGLPTDNSLCIILFGNKLNDDGSMSDKFIARSKTALAIANKYPNASILVTGGHTAGWNYNSEAVTGKQWLINHGINANRIITEELSWDTGSNILCSFTTSELRNHTEITNFVVVSSDYHIPRCCFCLMTYIYALGYDLPKSQGGRGYQLLGNLGAVLN